MGWPVSALFSVVVVGGIGGGGGRGTEWQVQHNAHFLQINIQIYFSRHLTPSDCLKLFILCCYRIEASSGPG